MKSYDINLNPLPEEFDELISTSNPVVYWFDDRKHYKTMLSVDAAIEAVNRAKQKKYAAYSVATIKEGRMVMNVSFCGCLTKYAHKDRYFLGTNGQELYFRRKLENESAQEMDAFCSCFGQIIANHNLSAKPHKINVLPSWTIALQRRFPDLYICANKNGSCTVIEDKCYECEVTYKNNLYSCDYLISDEAYPITIDGLLTDKYSEIYTFKLDDLHGDSFFEAFQELDCVYEIR